MTRNRPQFIMRSIESILSQSYSKFNLIVSDNSTNNCIQKLIEEKGITDSRFKYLKRERPFESGIEHVNAIHMEVQSQYYMIFHDDDIMLPEMVEKLYGTIKEDHRIVAVGAFAYINKNGNIKTGKISKQKEIISTPLNVIKKYASNKPIAAFPSYMYNKSRVKNLLEKNKGGKYSDCSFIVSLAENGFIVHIPHFLMETTIHSGQDSQDHQFSEYLSLTTYLKKIIGKQNLKEITNLRIFNIYNERIRRYTMEQVPLYSFRILVLFLKYSPMNFSPKYILRILHLYNK